MNILKGWSMWFSWKNNLTIKYETSKIGVYKAAMIASAICEVPTAVGSLRSGFKS